MKLHWRFNTPNEHCEWLLFMGWDRIEGHSSFAKDAEFQEYTKVAQPSTDLVRRQTVPCIDNT